VRKLLLLLNNRRVRRRKYGFRPDEVLILGPRCLQNSLCTARVAVDPRECRRCGRCGVGDLNRLAETYGTRLAIATGGGIALAELARPEVKGVVSVACLNELLEGMLKKKRKPVLGVVIERPQGPCRDTTVSAEMVEEAIKVFLGR